MNTSSIIDHISEAIASTKVLKEPFPHLYIENIFPEPFYEEIEKLKEKVDAYKELNHPDAVLDDGTVTRLVFPFNEVYMDTLDGKERKISDQLLEVFESDKLKKTLFTSLETPLKRRFKVDNVDLIDAFPKSGLFSDLPGYSIRPHTDINIKTLTFQAYLPQKNNSQLCLGTSFYKRNSLYNWIDPEWVWTSKKFAQVFSFVKRRILVNTPEFIHEKVVPFKRNSCYAFVVDNNSWHGVEKLPYGLGDRFSLMNIYYTDKDQKFYDT